MEGVNRESTGLGSMHEVSHVQTNGGMTVSLDSRSGGAVQANSNTLPSYPPPQQVPIHSVATNFRVPSYPMPRPPSVNAPATNQVITRPTDRQNPAAGEPKQLSKAEYKAELKQAHADLKDLKAQARQAESSAFKGESVGGRMQAVNNFADKERAIAAQQAKISALRKANPSTVGRVVHSITRKLGMLREGGYSSRVGSSSSVTGKALGALEVSTLFSSAKQAAGGIVDNKRCKELIKVGEQRLQEIDEQLTGESDPAKKGRLQEERQTIQAGINHLEERMLLRSPTEAAQNMALAGVQAAQIGAMGVSHLAGIASPALAQVPIVGALVLPLAAGLAIDGLYAGKKNLNQANKDRALVEGKQQQLAAARSSGATPLDSILNMPELANQPGIQNDIGRLNNQIKGANKRLAEFDNELLKGNLSKQRIVEIRKGKIEARIEIENAMKVAVNMLEGKPQLAPVLKEVKAQQVLADSAAMLETNMMPFFQQKLKTKAVAEYIRAGGEVASLAGTACATGGLIASVTGYGLPAGIPLAVVGVALGIGGIVTKFASNGLANKIRNLQLGKDKVSTKQFNSAMNAQMKKEQAVWQSLSPEQQKCTATYAMFEMIRKHDPTIPKNWDAGRWAEALLSESDKGPRHKALHAATDRMLKHDSTKGIIGSVTKGIISRFSKSKSK